MTVLLSGLPLIAVIAALLARQPALRSAVLGVVLAAVIGAGWFDLSPSVAARAAASWWALVAEVALIVAGGIAFAEAGRLTGGQERLSSWLRRSLGTGIAPVLAIVHGVTPLAESLTGFGIGAMLAIPLLTALGLTGRRAATIGLLGLCAVPWGSMGPGTLIAAQLGGVGFDALGVASALLSLPVFVGVGVAAVLMVAPREDRLRACLAAVGSGAVLWCGVLVVNLAVGTAPAGAVGALLTLAVHLLVSRLRGHRLDFPREVGHALVPYLVLLVGVVSLSAVAIASHRAGEARYRQ
ncbi:MAG: hypothetical protein L0I06_03415, partial [Acidipropionibacterium jensenii]|nr:hypothetical protein [Acidipropionibacterium jensenii]